MVDRVKPTIGCASFKTRFTRKMNEMKREWESMKFCQKKSSSCTCKCLINLLKYVFISRLPKIHSFFVTKNALHVAAFSFNLSHSFLSLYSLYLEGVAEQRWRRYAGEGNRLCKFCYVLSIMLLIARSETGAVLYMYFWF